MIQIKEIYQCLVCGNIVEVLHSGAGELVCCKKPMQKLNIKTEDEGKEKHKPVIKENQNDFEIQTGSILHPMEKGHFIQFIEVLFENEIIIKKNFRPKEIPKLSFDKNLGKIKEVKILCNLHGIWKR